MPMSHFQPTPSVSNHRLPLCSTKRYVGKPSSSQKLYTRRALSQIKAHSIIVTPVRPDESGHPPLAKLSISMTVPPVLCRSLERPRSWLRLIEPRAPRQKSHKCPLGTPPKRLFGLRARRPRTIFDFSYADLVARGVHAPR